MRVIMSREHSDDGLFDFSILNINSNQTKRFQSSIIRIRLRYFYQEREREREMCYLRRLAHIVSGL
jgi:hypothetical protein